MRSECDADAGRTTSSLDIAGACVLLSRCCRPPTPLADANSAEEVKALRANSGACGARI